MSTFPVTIKLRNYPIISGGLSQDFVGSGQNRVTAKKTKFELGRVTAQRVILLLPSLIDNIYIVICVGLIQSDFRLTSHSVTIDTSG